MSKPLFQLGQCSVFQNKNGSFGVDIPIAYETGFCSFDDAKTFLLSFGWVDSRIGNVFEKL